ncbi:MAG: cell division protein ZapA (FtsZ GTPase activity inhibitor) [Saprospiraceae bacterium]|jgi:cell division protein ZapA (FtsZ GTPase activity inhibitor)
MEKDYTAVKINIMGRDYPVKCTKNEEQQLVNVEERLKQQLNQYRLKYQQLDTQDCLSMALIENQMDSLQSVQSELEQSYIDRIDHMQQELLRHIS